LREEEVIIMLRYLGIGLLMLGAGAYAFAGTVAAPEIDANSAAGAVALLAGGILVLRARKRIR
jgi:hypothetical protein